jgi:hypothetical protein
MGGCTVVLRRVVNVTMFIIEYVETIYLEDKALALFALRLNLI